jgi:hypothetical protein
VTLENLLGELDSKFLHGSGATDSASGGLFSQLVSATIQTLMHELTNIGGSGVGPATPDGGKGLGVGGLPDVSGHGSVSSLEEDSKPQIGHVLPGHH